MGRTFNHPKNIKDAKEIQKILSEYVMIGPLQRKIELIAGVDAAFYEDSVVGSVCLFHYHELVKVEDAVIAQKCTFPYIPGYLSFREAPVLIKAIEKLKAVPDVILVDGQGIAHPRLFGIASHMGVVLDIPTIGCAKARLVGEYKDPAMKKGSWKYLSKDGKNIGAVLRTRESVKPLFVSPGHLMDITDSIEIVMNCVIKYRIPEPIRCAHTLSGQYKKIHHATEPH